MFKKDPYGNLHIRLGDLGSIFNRDQVGVDDDGMIFKENVCKFSLFPIPEFKLKANHVCNHMDLIVWQLGIILLVSFGYNDNNVKGPILFSTLYDKLIDDLMSLDEDEFERHAIETKVPSPDIQDMLWKISSPMSDESELKARKDMAKLLYKNGGRLDEEQIATYYEDLNKQIDNLKPLMKSEEKGFPQLIELRDVIFNITSIEDYNNKEDEDEDEDFYDEDEDDDEDEDEDDDEDEDEIINIDKVLEILKRKP